MTSRHVHLGLGRLAVTAGVVAVAAGLPLAIELGEDLLGSRVPRIEAHAGDAYGITTPIRIGDRLPLTLHGGLVLQGDRLLRTGAGPAPITIDEAVLILDLSKNGAAAAAAVAPPDVRPGSGPQIAGFPTGSLKLRRASVHFIGPQGGQALMTDATASLTAARKGGYRIAGNGFVNGQRLIFDAVWTDTGLREGAGHTPLRITVQSAVLETTIDGVLRAGEVPTFAGHAEYKISRLAKLVSWLGLGTGIGEQVRSVVLSGPIEWSPLQTTFPNAEISIDGSSATGALTIKHGERLSLDGTLGFNELDLARYLPTGTGTAKGTAAGPATPMAAGQEPHVLTVVDADLRLSAAKVTGPAFVMGRAAVSIALNRGQLQADVAELQIEGGTAGGQLTVDLKESSPQAEVKLKLKAIDAGRVLAAPLRRNPLLGRANVVFEGTFRGRTLPEMMSSVAGRGQVDLVEPGRLGLDLPALIHAARAGGPVSWASAGKGGTHLDALGGRFRVLNGAITIETLQAKSGAATLAGSGRLDVPSRLLEMSIAWTGGSDQVAVAGSELLTMRGTWDAPAITVSRPPKAEVKADTPMRSN